MSTTDATPDLEAESDVVLAEIENHARTGGDPAGVDSYDEAPSDVNLGDAAAKGTGLTLMAQFIRAVFQFGSLIILARILAPGDFGVVASVTAIVGIADILRDFGLSSAAIQAKRLSNAERTNLFWANVGFGTLCALLTVAATPLIEQVYGNHALGPIVFSLAVVFIISGTNTQFNAELTRSLRFSVLVLSDLAGQAAGIVLAIVMAVAGAGYWAIVAQQIFTAVVIMVLNVTYCRWRPGLPRRDVSIRRFFRFGGGVFGTQLIAYTTKNIDNVAVGAYWGAATLGLYSRAYQLLMTPLNQINAPLTRIALPILSRVQDDDESFLRYLKKAQLVGCYLTATIFALFTALAYPIVDVLFGPRWHKVAAIFAVLSVGGVFRAIEQISYWIFLARGKTGAQFRLYVVTRPILIGMILAGVPWGAVGVATGCSAGYFMYWAVSLWWCGRATGIPSRPLFANGLRAVFLVSAPSGVAAYLGSLLVTNSVLKLALGLVAAVAYLALANLLSATVRGDLLTLVRFGKRTFARKSKGGKKPSAPVAAAPLTAAALPAAALPAAAQPAAARPAAAKPAAAADAGPVVVEMAPEPAGRVPASPRRRVPPAVRSTARTISALTRPPAATAAMAERAEAERARSAGASAASAPTPPAPSGGPASTSAAGGPTAPGGESAPSAAALNAAARARAARRRDGRTGDTPDAPAGASVAVIDAPDNDDRVDAPASASASPVPSAAAESGSATEPGTGPVRTPRTRARSARSGSGRPTSTGQTRS